MTRKLIIEKNKCKKRNLEMTFQYDSPPSNFIFKRVGMSTVTPTCGVIAAYFGEIAAQFSMIVACCDGSMIRLRFGGVAFDNCTLVAPALFFATYCKLVVFAPLCLAAK